MTSQRHMWKVPVLLAIIPPQVVSLAPVAVYPAVMIASMMGLARHRTGGEPFALLLVEYGFYALAIVYPLPVVASIVFAWRHFLKGNAGKAVIYSILPLLLLAALVSGFMMAAQ